MTIQMPPFFYPTAPIPMAAEPAAQPMVGTIYEPPVTAGMNGTQQLSVNNQMQIRSPIAKWNPATGMQGWITTLYQNILDRTPSQEELKPQLDFVRGNGAVGVYKQFFTSKEFQEKNLPPNLVVDKLYRSILFREPEPAGKQSWLETIRQGMPVEQVIDGFLASREYQENIAKGTAPVFNLNA